MDANPITTEDCIIVMITDAFIPSHGYNYTTDQCYKHLITMVITSAYTVTCI